MNRLQSKYLSRRIGTSNRDWTIFFADMASGGGSSRSTLVSWSLDITAVPEPANVALGIFAGVFVVGGLCRTQRVRDWLHRCRVAVILNSAVELTIE